MLWYFIWIFITYAVSFTFAVLDVVCCDADCCNAPMPLHRKHGCFFFLFFFSVFSFFFFFSLSYMFFWTMTKTKRKTNSTILNHHLYQIDPITINFSNPQHHAPLLEQTKRKRLDVTSRNNSQQMNINVCPVAGGLGKWNKNHNEFRKKKHHQRYPHAISSELLVLNVDKSQTAKPVIQDDADGHLIYHSGDILHHRCSWHFFCFFNFFFSYSYVFFFFSTIFPFSVIYLGQMRELHTLWKKTQF